MRRNPFELEPKNTTDPMIIVVRLDPLTGQEISSFVDNPDYIPQNMDEYGLFDDGSRRNGGIRPYVKINKHRKYGIEIGIKGEF